MPSYGYQAWIAVTIVVLLFASTITCVIIHFYKFFRSPARQTMATKNLTFYAFFLLLFYLYTLYKIWDSLFNIPEYSEGDEIETEEHYITDAFIWSYLLLQTSFLKLIMSLDIFFNFRKISKYLQRSSGSRNGIFLAYCLAGTLLPAFYALALVFMAKLTEFAPFEGLPEYLNLPARIIRIVRFGPIFGAFWYIRSASIDKRELWTKFSLQIRLLVMLGGFSAVVSLTEVVLLGCVTNEQDTNGYNKLGAIAEEAYFYMYCLGMVVEGALIAILFTFRKDTFRPVSIGGN